VTDIKI